MQIIRRLARSIDVCCHTRLRTAMPSAAFALVLALALSPSTGSAETYSIYDSYEGAQVNARCSSSGVELTNIYAMTFGPDKKTGKKTNQISGQDYVNQSTPLLSFSVNGVSDTLSNIKCSHENVVGGLQISATSSKTHLAFAISITPEYGATQAVIVSVQVTYNGADPTAFFSATLFPSLQIKVPNGNAMAMVPQMMGGILPVASVNDLGPGAPASFGLPTNINVLDIAELYDGSSKNTGGVFFTNRNANIAPVQFNLTNALSGSQIAAVAGYWTALLKPNQPIALPNVAIGAHASGDWNEAIKYYVAQNQPGWNFTNTPAWFREAGGIYLLGVAGGGSFFNTFLDTPLSNNKLGIALFDCNANLGSKTTGTPPNADGQRCLEDVHDDAQKLGTNVIYLTEWWQGGYGNKGDWIVDPDLGGAAGLKSVVGKIHKKGGKVILYLEAYVVAASSILASSQANNWQGMVTPEYPTYPTSTPPSPLPCFGSSVCMAVVNTQWQDYLINRAYDLMTATDVDGFFLDSWGWRMNYPVVTQSEDVNYTSQQWTGAAYRFVDRLRAKLQTYKANAIVMGENNTGQFPFHWDGGSAADLSFWSSSFSQDGGLLWGSPVRYATSIPNFFVNGSGVSSASVSSSSSGTFNGSALSSVNQVIASGHNLALGPFFLLDVRKVGTVTSTDPSETVIHGPVHEVSDVSNYVKSLVTLRNTTYKDALIDGTQIPVSTDKSNVLAYMYEGKINQVLTVVNNSRSTVPSVKVSTPKNGKGSWTEVLLESPTKANPSASDVTITNFSPAPAAASDSLGGLAIFARACGDGCMAATPTPGPTPPPVPLMNESFAAAPYGSGMSNWTDWLVSGSKALPSRRWSIGTQTTITGISTVETSLLQLKSAGESSLLFYDSFGGSDFTYIGGVAIDAVGSGGRSGSIGSAGLSFRLSDDEQNLDAGNQGYDVVLTNDIAGFTDRGHLKLLRRQASTPPQPLSGCTPQVVSLALGHTYNMSVTAVTTWATNTSLFGTPNPSDPNDGHYPAYPVSTTFTVSIDGTQQLSCTDTAPYFSGRFGVNGSNVNAHFTCLQANGPTETDGPMPLTCAPIIVQTRPPPGQKTQTPSGQRLPQ